MAEVGQRQRRAEGREQRRARADNESKKSETSTGVGPQLQRALMSAGAAALAGGLAGAAKAVADRRGRRSRPDEDNQEVDDRSETHDEPAAQQVDVASDEEETSPSDVEEQAGRDDEDEAEADGPQDAERSEPSGAPSGDVAKIIARAREEVEQVLGCEAEGVSGIERSNGGWSVIVEVVELRRVPESTDVLASYAVVLDGDGDLVSLERTRRYRRSQVEDG